MLYGRRNLIREKGGRGMMSIHKRVTRSKIIVTNEEILSRIISYKKIVGIKSE